MRKARFAHDASQHHAPGHFHADRLRIERSTLALVITEMQIRRLRVGAKIVRKCRQPALAQCGELSSSLGDQLVLVDRGFELLAHDRHPALLQTSLQ